jgi:hypothetical protein
MQKQLLVACAACSLLVGCAADGSSSEVVDPPLVPSAPMPAMTGSYVSTYRVPTTAELQAAALFPVDHADWIIANGVVTLDYKLPVGLVGGLVDVTLTGAITPGATTVELAGAQGIGHCVATATTIKCREEFANLGQLPISMAVVEQTAALEYAGPAADRVDVATVFSSDPIGIVELDLSKPFVDDHGGHGMD